MTPEESYRLMDQERNDARPAQQADWFRRFPNGGTVYIDTTEDK